MRVEKQRVKTRLIRRNVDTGGPFVAGADAAKTQHRAAFVAVVQEDLDAIDAAPLLCGRVHGETLDDDATLVDGVTGGWIADLEHDRRWIRPGCGGRCRSSRSSRSSRARLCRCG